MRAQAIQAKLTGRLMMEIPRFFGGRLPAFRELFQNAYRAGAKNVRLTLEGQTLTVEDDGAGCADPQLLLSAGQTGWDEGRIVEPAGLGFFSLLAQDVSASVIVESSGWRVHLVPAQVLAQKPVVVMPGEVTQGLKLVILLTEPRPEQDLREARAFYPFRVTLNGEDIPPHTLEGIELSTPVGRVLLSRQAYPREESFPVWEHRPIRGGGAFGTALKAAARGPIQEGILGSYRIRWVADMACGVTPKLPDRNDLQQSPALSAACGTILASIERHFVDLARAILASWPETTRHTYGSSAVEMPDWLVSTQMGNAILKERGWVEIDANRWGDLNVYYVEDDGWTREQAVGVAYTRKFVRVRDPHVADTMNTLADMGADLPWAVCDPEDPHALALKVVGRKGSKEAWVRLAREIRVGPHKLPFLLDPGDGDRGHALLACDAETAVRALMGTRVSLIGIEGELGDLLAGFILCHDYDSLSESWGQHGVGESYVDWRELTHDLVQQVTTDYLPKALARARAEHHALVLARDDLRDLQRRADRLAASDAFRGDAGVKNARVGLHRAERRLEKRLKAAAARARL